MNFPCLDQFLPFIFNCMKLKRNKPGLGRAQRPAPAAQRPSRLGLPRCGPAAQRSARRGAVCRRRGGGAMASIDRHELEQGERHAPHQEPGSSPGEQVDGEGRVTTGGCGSRWWRGHSGELKRGRRNRRRQPWSPGGRTARKRHDTLLGLGEVAEEWQVEVGDRLAQLRGDSARAGVVQTGGATWSFKLEPWRCFWRANERASERERESRTARPDLSLPRVGPTRRGPQLRGATARLYRARAAAQRAPADCWAWFGSFAKRSSVVVQFGNNISRPQKIIGKFNGV